MNRLLGIIKTQTYSCKPKRNGRTDKQNAKMADVKHRPSSRSVYPYDHYPLVYMKKSEF